MNSAAPAQSRPGVLRHAAQATLAVALACAAFGALAQYKIVGPDGKITYTDKPPSPAEAHIGGGVNPAESGGGLPYAVRQASARYPVTLYAGKNCSACDQARSWLRSHAVPFNEYSLNTDDDLAQLRQRFGDLSAPVITIGTQTLKGYTPSELQSFIDAAGYPKDARLVGYVWPAATPLAPTTHAAPAATPQATSPAANLPPPSRSGIQF